MEWLIGKVYYSWWMDGGSVGVVDGTDDAATRLFHRSSVIVTDQLLTLSTFLLMLTATISKASNRLLMAMLLLVFNAGLLVVDSIHFQYNGVLLGLLILSITALVRPLTIHPSNQPSNHPSIHRYYTDIST
jgi:alpha-1,3-glucosyltransferase